MKPKVILMMEALERAARTKDYLAAKSLASSLESIGLVSTQVIDRKLLIRTTEFYEEIYKEWRKMERAENG